MPRRTPGWSPGRSAAGQSAVASAAPTVPPVAPHRAAPPSGYGSAWDGSGRCRRGGGCRLRGRCPLAGAVCAGRCFGPSRRGLGESGERAAIEGGVRHPGRGFAQAAMQIVVLGHGIAGVGHVAERFACYHALPHPPPELRAGQGPGVGSAGVEAARDPYHDRHRVALRRRECRCHHLQAGARRVGLHHRQLHQIGQGARVLVVLGTIRARVVAENDHQPGAQRRQIQRHQRVHHHVHADALGAHQGTTPAEAGADRHLQRDPFVGRPLKVAALPRAGLAQLDKRRHGRRAWRAGVAGDAADAGAHSAVGQRLTAADGLRNVHDGSPSGAGQGLVSVAA